MENPREIISPVQETPQQRIKIKLLPAAHALTGNLNKEQEGSRQLENVLRARLIDVKRMNPSFWALTEQELETINVDALQYATGDTAMKIVEQINIEERRGAPPELSLTDQSALRMLVALIFRWKLSKETEGFNTSTSTSRKQHLNRLQQTTLSLLRIIFPDDEPKHSTADMLPSTFSLGWLTPGECEDGPYIRASTLRLLSSFGLGESMQMLGVTLNVPHLPATAKNAIKYLLSRRILQTNGLRAFLSVMLGEEHDESPLAKYEHLGTLMSTPPRGTPAEEYFRIVVPQILDILLQEQSSSRMPQAASYILSVLLSTPSTSTKIYPFVSSNLFAGFRNYVGDVDHEKASYTPLESIKISSKFFTMAPPTAEDPLIVKLLEPVIEKLYTLLYYLETRAISDPMETETCKGLLLSWMKVVSPEIATERLWALIEGKGGEWFLDDDANNDGLILRWMQDIVLRNIKISDLGDLEKDAMSANSLNLRPDPIHLVSLLKDIGRKEVASLLFIRILSADGHHRSIEPTRELLRMQLLYQMQHQLPSSILSNPSHALAFIDHVMTTVISHNSATQVPETSLRFVRSEEEEESESQSGDLLRTAVDFLLSSLEANPDYVPPFGDPHVSRVTKKLRDLSLHSSIALRQASREASLVLTARLSAAAVKSTQPDNTNEDVKNGRERYQEALILLQDPLLPVRAQGLAMLRHLVEPNVRSTASTSSVEAALVPAILDIFVNSAQNEDSFIFLNAVKGLVAMVQTFGKDVFKRLLEIYITEPLSSGNMNKQELDVKLRIGEALSEVIGNCGQSLGGYVDILLRVVLATIRDQSLPTTLRTSAISLASKCVETAPLAMSGYSPELSGAMIDILELEHTVLIEPRHRRRQRIGGSGSELSETTCGTEKEERGVHNRRHGEAGDLETDEDPVGINPKLSPLRRSAIHLLGAIILQFLRTVREGGSGDGGDGADLRGFPARRAATVLRYLSVHDADAVVNVMATEVVALLSEVGKARLGLA